MRPAGGGEQAGDWVPPFTAADDADGERYGDRGGRHRGGVAVTPAPVAWYVRLAGRLLMLCAIGLFCAAVFGGLLGVSTTVSKTAPYVVPITTAQPIVHITGAASRITVVPIAADDTARANTVTVEAVTEVRHLSRLLAQRDLELAVLEPDERDGEVYIDTQPAGEGGFFFERRTRVAVYVPRGSAIDLRVQAGSAAISGIDGRLTVNLSGGNLELIDVTIGDRSSITLNGGNLDLDGRLQSGAALGVEVNGGNASIRLPLRTEARVKATAEAGHLDIAGWSGVTTTARGRNASSDVSGFLYKDPNAASVITLRVNAGNISLHPAIDPPVAPPAAPAVPEAPKPVERPSRR